MGGGVATRAGIIRLEPAVIGWNALGHEIKSNVRSLEDFLLAEQVGPWQKFKARFSPVFIGSFRPRFQGATGMLDYYVFRCSTCKRLQVGYAHGSGKFYCRHCH